jgi:hypothetical protein
MIPALGRRGFGYGSGIIDPDHRRFILNIPKNASSYMLDWAGRHEWRAAMLCHYPGISEMIVILRDPLERWISGMAQYLRTYILSVHGPNGPIFPGETVTEHDYMMPAELFCRQYNDLVERLIFDVVDRFDDHVWPQHELIPETGDQVKRTFFRVDQDLTAQISAYLGFHAMENLDRNRGDADPDIAKLQAFLRQRLEARPELRERVLRYYHRDRELLSGVENAG